MAVVVSNDSDLLGPIKIVRNELDKKVGVLNPQKHPSRAILPHIDFIKQIRAGALLASLFPDQLSAPGVVLRHPMKPLKALGQHDGRLRDIHHDFARSQTLPMNQKFSTPDHKA